MNEKIQAAHLQRAAYVYIRQSTAHQVLHHREGQQRQYDLAQRARDLGFSQVVVIDDDLGRSGSGLHERPGFGRLLAAVCQGLAGAVLALEASRLARNNRDWHHLVDLCALTETLLIDDDGVYSAKLLNDRLLLGLKGTMSEFELGLLRQRARAAYLQKARRGYALWQVPVGFVRSEDERIEMTPDRQVQQAVTMVFTKFRELGSANQTLFWLREQNLSLPRAKSGTDGREISWELASSSRVRQILSNPCYAGAFAYGRTAVKNVVVDGRVRRSATRSIKPMEQWEILIIDHHPGYILWSEYLENRQLMSRNLARREGQPNGAVKKGAALLSGLLRCGRCGRKLRVNYCGAHGEVGRYVCSGRRDERGSGSCLSLGSLRVDRAVAAEFLEAVAPAGVEAALRAGENIVAADQTQREAVALALERARYEAARAQRQYDATEPENRLVAAELEARWNAALANVRDLEDRLNGLSRSKTELTVEQRERLMRLGSDLQLLWDDPEAPVELKKRLLRSVIEDIVVNLVEVGDEHCLQIHWAGGVHTELRVPQNPTGSHRRVADQEVIELVRELSKVCPDKAIAAVLNRLACRTGQDNPWSHSRVVSFRHTHDIPPCGKREGWVTLQEAARLLGVGRTLVSKLIERGVLPAKQVVQYAPWVIERSDLELPQVQAAARAAQEGKRIPWQAKGQDELSLQ